MTPEHGNRGRSGIDASPSGRADFTGTLSKGVHVAIEGEIRSHEYQREVVVGTQRTSIPQRVWEIRVDSVLKLDRAAKRESNDNSHEEVPR
jgi:single-strand DNA-binding protein